MNRPFSRAVLTAIRTCVITVVTMTAVLVSLTGGMSFWLTTWLWVASTKEFTGPFAYSCRNGDINLEVYLQPEADDHRPASEGIPNIEGFGFRDDVQLHRTYSGDVELPELAKRVRHIQLNVPWWFVAALFWAYPVVVFIRGPVRRFQRKRHNGCLKCGYGLTGNVSGVCPECGTKIANAETPKSQNAETVIGE